MTTVPEHIKQAQDNYLKGIATEAEKETLEQWFQENNATMIEVLSANPAQEALTRSKNFASITRQLQLPAAAFPPLSILRVLQPAIQVAAVIILLAAGIYYFTSHNTQTEVATTQAPADTSWKPGSDKAILTLFNGTSIILDPARTGLIAQQNQLSISLSQTGSLIIEKRGTQIGNADTTANTLTVPHGGEFQTELPDGSSVRLNAGSTLRFPATFTGPRRVVELEGEALFTIAANATMPFYVKAGNTNITVLGTRFNISAYKNEPQITTLLSGRVRVNTTGTMGKELLPGQQAVQQSGHINVHNADTTDAIGWTSNLFVFNELPVNTALMQIARWHNLTITYENGIPDIVLNGSFPRNTNLAETLEILRKLNLHFKMKNREMIVLHS